MVVKDYRAEMIIMTKNMSALRKMQDLPSPCFLLHIYSIGTYSGKQGKMSVSVKAEQSTDYRLSVLSETVVRREEKRSFLELVHLH